MEYKSHYRRNLPHIVRVGRPLFLTFDTLNRWVMPPGARTLVLRHALAMHKQQYWMHAAVVMPDHVHLVFTLLQDQRGNDFHLATVMKGIKGSSARSINKLLGETGSKWQDESFDHVIRNYEWTRAKIEYVCNNPVREGLVDSAEEWPWLWRSWIEGGERGLPPLMVYER